MKSYLERIFDRIDSRTTAKASGRDEPASREVFDRAYEAAIGRHPRFFERLWRAHGALGAAAAVFVMLVAGMAFHAAEYRHAWADLSPVHIGDTIHATTARDITVYLGFTPAKIIRLDRGASLKRESNRWELSNGTAAIRVRHAPAGRAFHLKTGDLHLVSRGPVDYTVDAANAGPNAITVSVRQGTVHCCDIEPEVPIDAGDRITLKRAPGSRTQIVAFESD